MPIPFLTRLARAKNAGFDENVYHGTRSDFDEFKRGDFGFHVGTPEQASDRALRKGILGGKTDVTGAQIMPLKANLGKSLQTGDATDWNDPSNVAETLFYSDIGKKYGEELLSLQDEIQIKKGGAPSLGFSENKKYLNQLRDLVKSEGYDSITYKNIFEGDGNSNSHILFNSNQLRSINAEFDPAKTESGNLLASAAPVATGLLGAAALQPEDAEAAFFPARFVLSNPREFVTELNPKATPENLEKAEKMFREGRSGPSVFRETGFFKGADGGLRFEVSDDTSKFKEEPKLATKEDGTVTRTELLPADQYLDHPALRNLDRPFGETPYMQFVPSEDLGGSLGRMLPGSASDGRDAIQVTTSEDKIFDDSRYTPKSILMHELQHSAQEAAGLSPGTNPKAAVAQINKGLLDYDNSKQGAKDQEAAINLNVIRKMMSALRKFENLQELRKYATDSNLTGKRRLLVGRGDWYEHGDDIRRELGPEPKRHRPKAEREQWLSAAWSKLAERQRDEIFEDDLQRAYLVLTGKRGKIVDEVRPTGKSFPGLDQVQLANSLFGGVKIPDDRLESFLSTVQEEFGSNAFTNAANRAFNQSEKFYAGDQRQEFRYKINQTLLNNPPSTLYRNAAGEVEARNVQNRLNMTMDERLESYPPLTEDVPREDQILIDSPLTKPQRGSIDPRLAATLPGVGLLGAAATQPTTQEKFQGILDAAANAGQALTAPAADAPFTAIDALKFGLSDSFPFVTGFTNTPEEVRARQAARFAQMDFQPGALGQQYTENAQRALGNSPILNALGNVYSNSRILQTPERAITQFADLLPDRGRLVGGSILSALGL